MNNKIKKDILDKFKELNAGENHVIPSKWLKLIYYPSLNPKEKESFKEGIEGLINDGLIASVQDTIKLTKKGADKIYPGENPKEKVKDDILNKFREINAGENHVIPSRWLSLIYYPTLNPKEKKVFEEAIEELINEEIVLPSRDTIKLTKKGFDRIY